MSTTARRGPWSPHEDSTLLKLVDHHGPHNWVRISQFLGTRSPKQCRERYHQNLKPSLIHEPITPEEGEVIERMVAEMGKRWAEISRRLPGRSDNAVKNWWNGGMNRRRRIVVRREGGLRGGPNFNETAEPLSFARPASVPYPRPSISVPTHQRRIEPPLTSPAHSEVSMPDSLGEAPSLVSDSSSHFSVSSPNVVAPSSYRYLPPPLEASIAPADHWRLMSGVQPHAASTHGFSSTLDRSPPTWGQREVQKSQYVMNPSNHRLEQLSEVATRSEPQRQPQSLQNQRALPSVYSMASNFADYPRHPLPHLPYPAAFIPHESRPSPFRPTDPALHSTSTVRSIPPAAEILPASSSSNGKRGDTEGTPPPSDRERMTVAAILD